MVDESVTACIAELKLGGHEAAQQIWERYFKRLISLARRILETTPRRAADEEDVALSAFNSFCVRAAKARFPKLEDRDDLWKILMTITVRKAIRLARREGARQTLEMEFLRDQITNQGPTPEFAALVNDEFEHLFGLLGDDTLSQVAIWKLEAYTNKEIARKLGRSVSFVERRLRLIRQLWSQEVSP